jgi:site-specific DNA-methyltransferase (adenine-specific)
MTIKLLHIDCMEYMATLPDKAFDLAIVDPPYGIGIDGQKETVNKNRNPKQKRKSHEHKGWDNAIPANEYFRELERVSSNQIIWGANYFIEHLSLAKKGWIFWFKGQEGLTMSDGELAYSSFDKPTRQVNINRGELLKDGTIHPTQKPVKLYEWLLTNYAKPSDRILDTHLGSGSSAIAAHNLGFDFVGCELDRDYYEAAHKRFNAHAAQQSLFGNETDFVTKRVQQEVLL